MSFSTFSQKQPYHIGINLGVNSAKSKYVFEGDAEVSEAALLPEFGFSIFNSLAPGKYYRTGLNISSKGGMYKSYGEYEKEKMNYLEIPFDFGFRHSLQNNLLNISVFGGPYFAYAISGKYKYKYDGEPLQVNDIFSGNTDSQPRRFNYGIEVGGGLEISQKMFFTIKLSNSFGKLYKGSDNLKTRYKTSTFGLTYLLN